MLKQSIKNALPIVATAYGEKFGVDIRIGNDLAYTDGKTITLPNIPNDYPHMDVLWGYLAHESGHIRFSDFSVKIISPLHGALTNILEDCRIERAMMSVYPGTVQTLNEVASYMVSNGQYVQVTTKDPLATVFTSYCLYWLQTKKVGQTVLQVFLDNALTVLQSLLPINLVQKLNDLLNQVVDTKSTEEVADLASKIIQWLKNTEQEQKALPPKDQNNATPKNQHDSSINDEISQQEENASFHVNAKETQLTVSDVIDPILNAELSDLRGDTHDSLKAELFQAAKNQRIDHDDKSICSAQKNPSNDDMGQHLLHLVQGETSKIRTQLLGLIQSKQRIAYCYRRKGKKVVLRKLHNVLTGNTKIFSSSKEKVRPNTAIHILVDMSGSMRKKNPYSETNKEYQEIAKESALAIALALEEIQGVNPAVTFFSGKINPVYSIVSHGSSVKKNVGRFSFCAKGSTPMSEGIWYAAYELTKTKEKRKMIMVITDGVPNNTDSCEEVIKLCEDSAIEFIGVGIETNSVKHFFKNNMVINDVCSLQKNLFKMIEDNLM